MFRDLICRLLGHSPKFIGIDDDTLDLTFRCSTCGLVEVDEYGKDF